MKDKNADMGFEQTADDELIDFEKIEELDMGKMKKEFQKKKEKGCTVTGFLSEFTYRFLSKFIYYFWILISIYIIWDFFFGKEIAIFVMAKNNFIAEAIVIISTGLFVVLTLTVLATGELKYIAKQVIPQNIGSTVSLMAAIIVTAFLIFSYQNKVCDTFCINSHIMKEKGFLTNEKEILVCSEFQPIRLQIDTRLNSKKVKKCSIIGGNGSCEVTKNGKMKIVLSSCGNIEPGGEVCDIRLLLQGKDLNLTTDRIYVPVYIKEAVEFNEAKCSVESPERKSCHNCR